MLNSLISSYPKYETSLPSSDTKVWFRPILVKEEKKLVVVQQFGTGNEIIKAMVETVQDCFDIKDANLLPVFDLEYLFLKLRSKSIGSILDFSFVCNDTGEKIKTKINLDKIQVQFHPDNKKQIVLDNQIIVNMRYPNANDFMDINIEDPNSLYKLSLKCMEQIQTVSELIDCSNQSEDELEEFLDNLTPINFSKIANFFETMPKIEEEIKYTTSDGVERSLLIKGIKDFF
jgi:hypothetical protein